MMIAKIMRTREINDKYHTNNSNDNNGDNSDNKKI